MNPKILGCFEEADVRCLLEETGVLRKVSGRGFHDLEVEIDASGQALTHLRLHGTKSASRYLLFDACLATSRLESSYFAERDFELAGAIELLVIYWFREQDPTARFTRRRPPLPLQDYPGLGTLRQVFQTAVLMAKQTGSHAIAAFPKLFHDAFLYHRSRLFLFLDAAEQGRFEALLRNLDHLPLLDATLAVMGDCVRNGADQIFRWQPGFQVFPLSPRITGYFHSQAYADQVAVSRDAESFHVDEKALEGVRSLFAARQASIRPSD